jgi:hypothetical protein
MKNKLLLTTALISGLSVIGSASFAETKITGEIKTGYKSGEKVGATVGTNNGFFRESQLNVTKSGDLNNGLKYSAGFSFEADGNDSGGATGANDAAASQVVLSDEAFFIEIASGDTAAQIGLDKFPGLDQSAAPRVAENAATALGGYALSTYSQSGNTIAQSFTAGVIQKTPIGQIALNYSPDVSDKGTGDGALVSAGGGNTGYELTYRGKPIKAAPGLDIFLARSVKSVAVASNASNGTKDTVETAYSAGYNFGKFAVGFDRRNRDDYGTAGTDIKQTEISGTAAVSDNVSIGIGKIDIDNSTLTLDEEITYVQVGYNMGAIFSSFGMFDVENGTGSAANEGKLYSARLGVKF